MTRHIYIGGILLSVLLGYSSLALAGPRDVRQILAENGISPGRLVPGPVLATTEPEMFLPWPHILLEKPLWVAQFDPLDTDSITLSEQQTAEFYAILTDRKTYSPSGGGKACLFHTDAELRIPAKVGSITVLICLGCNQLALERLGNWVALSDIDSGRNRIILFLREIFPNVRRFHQLQLDTALSQKLSVRDMMEWAEMCIPDDPFFKSLAAKKSAEISDDELEELDERCVAAMDRVNEQEAEKQKGERELSSP